MRVGIADDSALFREGLELLLRRSGVDVVILARTADELCESVQANPPDVVIVDVRMPPSFSDEGLVAAQRLRKSHPKLGILLLSAYAEVDYAVRLFENGEDGLGYLLKDRVDNSHALIEALNRVAAGESVVDDTLVARLLRRAHKRTIEIETLTERERDVLRLTAEGKSNLGIAQELNIGQSSVEVYISRLFNKLNISAGPEDNRRVLAALEWLRQRKPTES